MAVDVEKVVQEFVEMELDPARMDVKRIYSQLLMIKQTLDLTSLAHCRNANSYVASLMQDLTYKQSKCHYWEVILTDELKRLRLLVRRELLKAKNLEGTTVPVRVMDFLTEEVELDERVAALSQRLANAEASRKFWQGLLDVIEETARVIGSSMASLGVEAKVGANMRS